MKQKKRIKMKKNGLIFALGISFIGIIGIFLFLIISEKNDLKNIKNYYSQYAVTAKKAPLYNKNKKKIGTLEKNISLELTKIDPKKYKSKYFKIKDTNYYILYKDIKKEDKKEDTNQVSNYLVFNQNIKTNKKITLYQNKKRKITLLNGINVPIEYQDKKNYYISFLKEIYAIPKNKKIKLIEKENTKEQEEKEIAILEYKTISNTCSGYDCVNTTIIEDQTNKLKENGYYFINIKDYQNFITDNIHLKEKAVLLTIQEENDFSKKIIDELKIPLEKPITEENSKSKKYQIKSYTTLENILKMANKEEVIEKEPVINNQGIAVLNYHFFYDAKTEGCNETICLDTAKFREHLNYLRDNNYKTLTMEEFKRWMYGEIELPEKSVLITVDDGAMGTGKHNGNKLIPILEEYKMNATLFLIAGWWDINNYRSPYLNIQSHTFDMHQYGSCGNGQINCATLEEAKADLQKSLDIIGNNDSFCFPFYSYSDTSLKAVKDMGFKLSFVGGMRKATRNSNKYLIPRYPIHSDITLDNFISMVK